MVFKNRNEAGVALAKALLNFKELNPLVFGLPRGGVPVAAEVAKGLQVPLDVIVVRKLGVPWQPELAFGAIGESDVIYLNKKIIDDLKIDRQSQKQVIDREKITVRERQLKFRGNNLSPDLIDRVSIIVDDGIATGATIKAACKVARKLGAAEIVVATPVATKESIQELKQFADQSIVLTTPEYFYAVGQWYEDFAPVPDEEVQRILQESKKVHAS